MEIVNKVAQSGLLTINPEDLIPPGERVLIDLKDWLFEGLILKEKDFREKLDSNNWQNFRDKNVAITCTADAIVPTWAFMLIAVRLQPFTSKVFFGSLEEMENHLWNEVIESLDPELYRDQRVVIKGCSTKSVPLAAYVVLSTFLTPLVKSIMYGEPCSTVPVFKRKN